MSNSQPANVVMFRRALVLRCPQCGSRRTFIKRWVGRYDRCRSCGIRWHREHGFELGPVTLNVVFTFLTLGISMVAAFVATAPDFPVGALTGTFVGVAVLMPIVVQPFTYTIWLAFDLATRRPDESELADAATFSAQDA